MTFAEELTPQERDTLLAEILAKITPKKKPPRSGLRKTNANMRKFCKPPDGCFPAHSLIALRGQVQRVTVGGARKKSSI